MRATKAKDVRVHADQPCHVTEDSMAKTPARHLPRAKS
jgi:hypothetical protein